MDGIVTFNHIQYHLSGNKTLLLRSEEAAALVDYVNDLRARNVALEQENTLLSLLGQEAAIYGERRLRKMA
ncbi:MAG: hypothetical protein J7639_24805 [Paenibacillaceae bacterium]|nr:hypothetical protein [Paenibacillaceae bacterium]